MQYNILQRPLTILHTHNYTHTCTHTYICISIKDDLILRINQDAPKLHSYTTKGQYFSLVKLALKILALRFLLSGAKWRPLIWLMAKFGVCIYNFTETWMAGISFILSLI